MFNKPIWVLFPNSAAEYTNAIGKPPMDLQTVDKKLQQPFDGDEVMGYRNLGHFAQDVRWIWEASKIYNKATKALPPRLQVTAAEAEAAEAMAREAGGGDLIRGAEMGPFEPSPRRVLDARLRINSSGIPIPKPTKPGQAVPATPADVIVSNYHFIAATMELEFEAIWGEFTLQPWERIRRRAITQELHKRRVAKQLEAEAAAPKISEEEKRIQFERRLEQDRLHEAATREKEKTAAEERARLREELLARKKLMQR